MTRFRRVGSGGWPFCLGTSMVVGGGLPVGLGEGEGDGGGGEGGGGGWRGGLGWILFMWRSQKWSKKGSKWG